MEKQCSEYVQYEDEHEYEHVSMSMTWLWNIQDIRSKLWFPIQFHVKNAWEGEKRYFQRACVQIHIPNTRACWDVIYNYEALRESNTPLSTSCDMCLSCCFRWVCDGTIVSSVRENRTLMFSQWGKGGWHMTLTAECWTGEVTRVIISHGGRVSHHCVCVWNVSLKTNHSYVMYVSSDPTDSSCVPSPWSLSISITKSGCHLFSLVWNVGVTITTHNK